jgi:sugar phosphate isomerase/epimerase
MYCTNVHPAETLAETLSVLSGPVAAVARRLRRPGDGPYAVGLRLSAAAAREAAGDPSAVRALAAVLAAEGLSVAHVNAFPFGAFHMTEVGARVYSPDWSDPRRLAYSLDVARVLAALLPPGATGSLSTVPLGYAPARPDLDAVRRHLDAAEAALARLEAETDRHVVLALEPEPDCVAEDAPSLIAHIDPAPHRGVCLDVCHAAVVGEDPAAAFRAYRSAGFEVPRVQVSAALKCADDAALAPFLADRVYLHQRRGDRVHFHVPLFWPGDGALGTTRDSVSDDLLALALQEGAALEIETYTYSVLPVGLRPESPAALADALVQEEKWLADRINALS